jgi:PAS domain S-box-containing protein
VFDPNYGVVKVDLVDKIGNIVSLTKNIAGLLGYQRNEVIGIKVNKIMPYIFARHHDKFLNNFI